MKKINNNNTVTKNGFDFDIIIGIIVFFHIPIIIIAAIIFKKVGSLLRNIATFTGSYFNPVKDICVNFFGFKLFVFICLGIASSLWAAIFNHTAVELIIRWSITYFLFIVATSEISTLYKEGSAEFSQYLDKKNLAFLKYDWILHMGLYSWITVLFYIADSINLLDKLIASALFIAVFLVFLARIYLIATKKNPWPFKKQVIVACIDCVKVVVPLVTLATIGPKAVYGANYRGTFQDRIGSLFTGIRSDSEMHYSAVNYEIQRNPKFNVNDFKISGTNFLDEPKFEEHMIRRAKESSKNIVYNTFLRQINANNDINNK